MSDDPAFSVAFSVSPLPTEACTSEILEAIRLHGGIPMGAETHIVATHTYPTSFMDEISQEEVDGGIIHTIVKPPERCGDTCANFYKGAKSRLKVFDVLDSMQINEGICAVITDFAVVSSKPYVEDSHELETMHEIVYVVDDDYSYHYHDNYLFWVILLPLLIVTLCFLTVACWDCDSYYYSSRRWHDKKRHFADES